MTGILVVVLGVAVVAGAAYLLYRADQARKAALRALAAEHGWRLTERDDHWGERFDGPPFGTGARRQARQVLEGSFGGRDLLAFEYSYQTFSRDAQGRRRTATHRYAVSVLRLPAPLPVVQLTPESLLTRVGGALGLDDVELGDEAFDKRYRVASPDLVLVPQLLGPAARAALVARPALSLRIAGTDALCWESGRLDPAELIDRLQTVTLVLDSAPAEVWTTRGG